MFFLLRFIRSGRSSRTLGFTLIELAIGLGVMGLLFAGIWRVIGNLSGQLGDQAIARQTKGIQQALVNYINGERSTILNVIPTSGTWAEVPFTSTSTSPGSLHGLKSSPGYPVSYLPTAMSQTNGLGQTYRLLIRNNNNKIEGYVIATGGGTTASNLPEYRMVQLAGMIGSDGGVIKPSDTANVAGAYGGWTLAKTFFAGPGWPGITLGTGDYVTTTFYAQSVVTADYLYRNAVSGHPEVNQMNTDIDMNSKSLNNTVQVMNPNDLTVTSSAGALYFKAANQMVFQHTAGTGTPTRLNVWGDISAGNIGSWGGVGITGTLAVGCSDPFNCVGATKLFVDTAGNTSAMGNFNVGPLGSPKFAVTGSNGDISTYGNITVNGPGTNTFSGYTVFNDRGSASSLVSVSVPGIMSVGQLGVTFFTLSAAGTANFSGSSTFDGPANFNGGMRLSGGCTVAVGGWPGYGMSCPSDRALKKDIHPIDRALDKLLAIQGVEFTWKKSDHKDIGVIAQDVEKVFPQIVSTDKETGNKLVSHVALVAPIIEAIRELKAQNDALKVEVEALKSQLEKKKELK